MEKEKYHSTFAQRKQQERITQVHEKKQEVKKLAENARKINNTIAKNLNKKNVFKGETDFFGRPKNPLPVPSKPNANLSTTAKSSPKYSKYSKHPVFFKYQEGFSNAVRRTVYVKDFL